MDLFKVIPQNLFSVLASKNKEIYLDALFVIHRAYKQEMFIKKDVLVTMLIADMEDKMLASDWSEEEELPEQNLSGMAHFLIRRLVDSGWIDIEYHTASFEEYVTMYDYSIRILNTLHDLRDTTPGEYNSYVYATYSLLKQADEERNDFIFNALSEAHRNTTGLVDALKSLLNNIRRYHQALSEQAEVRDVLAGHFDQFRELVGNKIYHPLKTFDSVPRFKTPILSVLRRWLHDDEAKHLLVESALIRSHYENRDEALDDIIVTIGEIIDIYENVDTLVREIDRKNSLYTKASVEKMQYLLNTDRSVKGKLVDLLKDSVREADAEKTGLVRMMQEGINVFSHGYLDEFSLYSPKKVKEKEPGEPLRITDQVDREALEKEFEELKDRVKKSYTTRRVMLFMEEQFAGREVVRSDDLKLRDDEDFVMLILGTVKHDERDCFYRIEFEDGYRFVDGYRVPAMTLRKKV